MKIRTYVRQVQLGCLLLSALSAAAESIYSTPYFFTTVAGVSSVGSADGPGSSARFFSPRAAAADRAGNLYVVDTVNHTIRRISPDGIVSTFAGLAGVKGSADGRGSTARFNHPRGITVDATGNIFVTDTENFTIRKITPDAVVSTVAGLAGTKGTDDGAGPVARFSYPKGATIDAAGNLYVSDSANEFELDATGAYRLTSTNPPVHYGAIRKISAGGIVTTLHEHLFLVDPAGVPGDGSETGAIAVDGSGNVFLNEFYGIGGDPADGRYSLSTIVRKYTPDGTVTDVELNTYSSDRFVYSSAPATITGSMLNDFKFDPTGNRIEALSAAIERAPSTGGTGNAVLAGRMLEQGFVDGPSSQARFAGPLSLATDLSGNIFAVDRGNNNVRKISPAGEVTTVAGLASLAAAGNVDGPGPAARFTTPFGLALDRANNLYVADRDAHVIRKITAAGQVTTLAGAPEVRGSADGTGSTARFNFPSGVAVDGGGTVYVADSDTVRKISPDGAITTLAGMPGQYGADDGTGSAARFNDVSSLAVDSKGNLFVVDSYSVRRVTASGTVTTLSPHYADGQAFTYSMPNAIAIDAADRLYVALSSSAASPRIIRMLSDGGEATALAPAGYGYADGNVATAQFNEFHSIAVDGANNVFVADWGNQTVRKLSSDGIVTTVGGLVDAPGNSDGTGSEARFYRPFGIAVDSAGNLLVSSGTTIRRGELAKAPVISTQPQSQTVAAGGVAQLSVTAGGVPAPTFQWLFNGGSLNGATSNSLTLSNVRSADGGDYTVVVTNTLGSVTSNKATLTIGAAPPSTPSSPSGGGGGSIDSWFALGLVGFGITRRFIRSRC